MALGLAHEQGLRGHDVGVVDRHHRHVDGRRDHRDDADAGQLGERDVFGERAVDRIGGVETGDVDAEDPQHEDRPVAEIEEAEQKRGQQPGQEGRGNPAIIIGAVERHEGEVDHRKQSECLELPAQLERERQRPESADAGDDDPEGKSLLVRGEIKIDRDRMAHGRADQVVKAKIRARPSVASSVRACGGMNQSSPRSKIDDGIRGPPRAARRPQSRHCHLRKIYPLTGKQTVTPPTLAGTSPLRTTSPCRADPAYPPAIAVRTNGFVNHVTATVGLRIRANNRCRGGITLMKRIPTLLVIAGIGATAGSTESAASGFMVRENSAAPRRQPFSRATPRAPTKPRPYSTIPAGMSWLQGTHTQIGGTGVFPSINYEGQPRHDLFVARRYRRTTPATTGSSHSCRTPTQHSISPSG